MKHTSMRSLPLALALALSFGVAVAQTSGSTGTTGGGTTGSGSSATGGRAAPAAQPGTGTRNTETKKDDALARGDRKFIQEAAESGMFEVQAAQLGATKATDPNVKSFASMLVDHHTAANNELTKLANSKKVELPAAPKRALRRDIEKLGKKSGAEFDRDFVRAVGIKAHEKDIKKFEKASENVKDPELKAWVTKTLPQLREHLAQAQKLPQASKSNAAAMGNRATPGGTGGASGANKTGS
jgi:putative membrane protein